MNETTRPDDGLLKAVIFDIDGTILRPRCDLQRIHMTAMATAVEQITGITTEFRYEGAELLVNGLNLSGYTDAGTIDLILESAGVSPAEGARLRRAVVDMMCGLVTQAVEGLDGAGDVLPGAASLIAALGDSGVIVGLSTGNARAVASCKMRAAGLAAVDTIGGFGDVLSARSAIAQSAVAAVRHRAVASSRALSSDDVVLVGDTPSDMAAARVAGIRGVGVCTGAAPAHLLARAGADLVVASLEELCAEDLVDVRLARAGRRRADGVA